MVQVLGVAKIRTAVPRKWFIDEIRFFMSRPRILLADDHRMFAEALSNILSLQFEVIGAVYNGRDLLSRAAALDSDPDVFLVNLTMPQVNGLEASRSLLQRKNTRRVIILTMHSDMQIVVSAFKAGVRGYVLKKERVNVLESAIYSVLDGHRFVSPTLKTQGQPHLLDRPIESAFVNQFELTTRQKEVMALLATGKGLKSIASRLNISIKTVEFHKYTLMERLGVENNAEIVRYALMMGLVPF